MMILQPFRLKQVRIAVVIYETLERLVCCIVDIVLVSPPLEESNLEMGEEGE